VLRRYRPDLYGARGIEIIGALVKSYPSHDFIIDLEELSEIGVPARSFTTEEANIFKSFSTNVGNLEEKVIELIDAQAGKQVGAGDAVEGDARGTNESDGPSATIRKVK
jgi:hypothetical protein